VGRLPAVLRQVFASKRQARQGRLGLLEATPPTRLDSNLYYRNTGKKDGDGTLLVENDGTVKGHHGRDAFDPSTYTYWLGAGKTSPKRTDAVDWVQGKIPAGSTVAGVRIDGA
jgi:hypothetical protein